MTKEYVKAKDKKRWQDEQSARYAEYFARELPANSSMFLALVAVIFFCIMFCRS